MTSPFLDHARGRYAALRSGIESLRTAAVEAGRDLTEDELRSVESSAAELSELAGAIEHLRAEDARALQVADVYAAVDGDGPVSSLPSLMPSRAQLGEMFRSLQEDGPMQRRWELPQHRAAVTSALAGVNTGTMDGGILPSPRRLALSAGLPVQDVAGVSGVTYPVFGAGAADVTAEGVAKTEYAAITNGAATPAMIAVWTDVTRQALMSQPAFEIRLRSKHAALVAKREDALMVARVLAAPTQTMTAGAAGVDWRDTLMRAAAKVLDSDVAMAPNLAVINPLDIVKFFPSATTAGNYGETPTTDLRLNLLGMNVYPSSAVTAGTALVGAWPVGATYVNGMSPTVFMDTMSQLKVNKVTILMEEACTLAVEEPSAFVSVTNFAA